jgi:sensor histidine kinase YesM
LEAKINPHFLYNSLNSIAGLIHEKPDKAEEMTIQLSKLFRYTTGRTEENFHTIEDELEIIKAYLAIEQVRFGKRLSYSIDCDKTVLSHKIPRFLLQPLVENAIKHGISKIAHAGEIKVEIKQINETISIKIHDNGPDFSEAVGGGFGLRSIKEKLNIVYAEKAIFEVKNEPEKAVIITIPLS